MYLTSIELGNTFTVVHYNMLYNCIYKILEASHNKHEKVIVFKYCHQIVYTEQSQLYKH